MLLTLLLPNIDAADSDNSGFGRVDDDDGDDKAAKMATFSWSLNRLPNLLCI